VTATDIPSGLDVHAVAPDFRLADQHGEDVSLRQILDSGRAALVVFLPFAFSGVCTGELQAMKEQQQALRNDRVETVVVSCDSMYSLRVFADREQLDFPLLSDYWPHGEVARAYGVFVEDRGCALRGSFLVGTDGAIAWQVVNQIPFARDVGEYVRQIAAL
jgi:mycoredoxin-dependent peroxiredoxin